MAKPLFIAKQSGHPTGWFGHVVARIMSRETTAVNRLALAALNIGASDAVLEVGFGHGKTIAEIATRGADVTCAGVDPSSVMNRVARKRCRRLIETGRVTLKQGSCADLPFDAAEFDKAITVHTTYFWLDIPAGLREVHRVLKPGGAFVVAFRPKEDVVAATMLPDSVYTLHSSDQMRQALRDAGFSDVTVDASDIGKGKTKGIIAIARALRS